MRDNGLFGEATDKSNIKTARAIVNAKADHI